MARFTHQSKRAKWILYSTIALAFPNFFAFIAGSQHFGGDALNGYVEAGHYYVCEHGSCNEVAQAVWQYSYWHALSAMGGILLIFIEVATLIATGDIVVDSTRRR